MQSRVPLIRSNRSDRSERSNRSFGWTSTIVLSLAGAWSTWSGGIAYVVWFTLAVVMAAMTFFAADELTRLNRASMDFGDWLKRTADRFAPIVVRHLGRTRAALRTRLAALAISGQGFVRTLRKRHSQP